MGSRSEEFKDDVGGNSATNVPTGFFTYAGAEHDAAVRSSNNGSRSLIRAQPSFGGIATPDAIRQERFNRRGRLYPIKDASVGAPERERNSGPTTSSWKAAFESRGFENRNPWAWVQAMA